VFDPVEWRAKATPHPDGGAAGELQRTRYLSSQKPIFIHAKRKR
jgi:hypothetical protein